MNEALSFMVVDRLASSSLVTNIRFNFVLKRPPNRLQIFFLLSPFHQSEATNIERTLSEGCLDFRMQVYTLGALVSLQLLDSAAFEDEDYDMDVVSGHVPPDLDGVLYRNVSEGSSCVWRGLGRSSKIAMRFERNVATHSELKRSLPA